MHLVVLCRIAYHVVVLQGARVPSVFGIESNLGVLSLFGLLGCYHDHTVGSACSVQGVRCRVLEYGHRLHIAGVDIVQVATVRCTIHDDKRVVLGIDRAESADAYRRIRTRLSAVLRELHTGYGSGQSTRHVAHLCLLQFVCIEYGRRAGKC